jgi:hypothetical protein
MLEVEDTVDLKEFLKKARTVWEDNHPFRMEKRGRPSDLKKVFGAIDTARLDGKLAGKPSQGKIIKVVQGILQKELEKQPEKQRGKSVPAEDTIRPYAKVWHMAKFKDREDLTAKDWDWLEKRNGLFWELFDEIQAQPKHYP